MSSSTPSTASSVVERVQDFVSEHKRALLIGAAVVVAAGGVAYYASTSSSSSSPPSENGDVETTRKKKKKSGKKKKAAKETDASGPILEEIKPQAGKVEEVKSEDVDAGTFLPSTML